MSNDNKVSQDRKEKVKKDKQELFEKVCLVLINEENNPDFIIRRAHFLTDAIDQAKKAIS